MSIENISFVVIARNEEFSFEICSNKLASFNCKNCEFIFVDSDSSDSTLELMKNFTPTNRESAVKVFTLKGKLNAAIARNVGLKTATKEFIFFVDGDTELHLDFIITSLNLFRDNKSIIGTTGQLEEQVYTDNFVDKKRYVKDRFRITKQAVTYKSGGNLFVRKSATDPIGLWHEALVSHEDFDFTLRLSRQGDIIAIPMSMGIHHTLEYGNKAFHRVIRGYTRATGFLLRRELRSTQRLKALVNRNSGAILGIIYYLGILSSVAFIVFNQSLGFITLITVFMVVLSDFFKSSYQKKDMKVWLITRFLSSLFIFIGFLFYHPKMKSDFHKEQVR